jgi:uncharacterized membrane protein YgcG
MIILFAHISAQQALSAAYARPLPPLVLPTSSPRTEKALLAAAAASPYEKCVVFVAAAAMLTDGVVDADVRTFVRRAAKRHRRNTAVTVNSGFNGGSGSGGGGGGGSGSGVVFATAAKRTMHTARVGSNRGVGAVVTSMHSKPGRC